MKYAEWCDKAGVLGEVPGVILSSYGVKYDKELMEGLHNLEDFEISLINQAGSIFMAKRQSPLTVTSVKEEQEGPSEVLTQIPEKDWRDLQTNLTLAITELGTMWKNRPKDTPLSDLGLLIAARCLKRSLEHNWKANGFQTPNVMEMLEFERDLFTKLGGMK